MRKKAYKVTLKDAVSGLYHSSGRKFTEVVQASSAKRAKDIARSIFDGSKVIKVEEQ